MKVLKVYGKKNEEVVYINGQQTAINEVEGNTFFLDNVSAYGYGTKNQLVIIEDESEMNFFNGSSLNEFEPVRVAYSLYKALSTLPGCGDLEKKDYDAETKTIVIWRNI